MKPILINNLEFAQKNLEISGDIRPLDCLRLGEMLSSNDKNHASIHYKLKGFAKKMHMPSMHLKVESTLPVLCQRCLEPMQVHLNLAFEYLISENYPSEIDESDEVDWLEPMQHMNLNELIEDELLIAMPIAPVHDSNCTQASTQSGEKPNPFAVLKGKF